MKEVDFTRAAILLDVIAKVTNVGPMNQPILGEAQEELKAIVADCNANREERAAKIREEEQIAQQQRLSAAEEANAQPAPEPPIVEPAATPPVDRKI